MKVLRAGQLVLAAAAGFGIGGYCLARQTTHDIAAHYYQHCRENLGLFEPMTTLQNGQSACAQLITEELGIENRWKDELR